MDDMTQPVTQAEFREEAAWVRERLAEMVTRAEFREEAAWVRERLAEMVTRAELKEELALTRDELRGEFSKRFSEIGFKFDALVTEMRKGFALLQDQFRASESRNAERMVAFAAKAEQYERKTLANDDKFRQARERLDDHELRIRKLESGEPRA